MRIKILLCSLWSLFALATQPFLEPISLENIHRFPMDRSLEYIFLMAYADLNQNNLVTKDFEPRAIVLLMSSVEKISPTQLNRIINLWRLNQDFISNRQPFLSLHLLEKFNDDILVSLETLSEITLTYSELIDMVRIIEKSKLIISTQLQQFEPLNQEHFFSNFLLTFRSLKYALCDYIKSFAKLYQPDHFYIED